MTIDCKVLMCRNMYNKGNFSGEIKYASIYQAGSKSFYIFYDSDKFRSKVGYHYLTIKDVFLFSSQNAAIKQTIYIFGQKTF